ncbi:hypothetical protein GLOIN_2v1713789 [Rhizophagus irregularis DAOM 181602=DAOM 197198]|uniref:Uncharacterized protein n=1 Tax=Rhizophagus irregularis (strain DAOM 181602 / DAOM 197198 / MUCL 43194) TaxID=747089 RepID=A0A2P4P4T7_RHIID|nr:hypothetical protein GLOIN_2v1713789 [Rhizophagus irregularis DAOM 181602=DAOM 197198]POG60395.1 hypothetical protein GLOIN_2v1713789 [Rhizophagus irregularis DAOM 181602=DAOM 197198]|eukprot:XP_025167261.1 hypothetical protein GLOIN_2v1713789 [Rhizophagus irregularis DAOM 181602=DAOM 197198]
MRLSLFSICIFSCLFLLHNFTLLCKTYFTLTRCFIFSSFMFSKCVTAYEFIIHYACYRETP